MVVFMESLGSYNILLKNYFRELKVWFKEKRKEKTKNKGVTRPQFPKTVVSRRDYSDTAPSNGADDAQAQQSQSPIAITVTYQN